jgi:sarcosine oxidase, subunit gamma
MSERAESALRGESFRGFATVSEAGLRGMVTLRADLSSPQVQAAVRQVAGVDLPGQRRIAQSGDGRGVAWMSPDEILVLCPRDEAGAVAAALGTALAETHHLVADVSDARAVLRVEGPDGALREVMAKLTPTDLAPDSFGPGELRRSRIAQVPAAFWIEDGGVTVICFRSVARYAFDLLRLSATPGGEVGVWT